MDVVVASAVLLALDAAWISLMLPQYRANAVAVQRGAPMHVSVVAVVLTYVVLVAGAAWLVRDAASGAVFGLVVYGVYNGTNAALLRAWNPTLALIDTAWGVGVCAVFGAVRSVFFTTSRR